MEKLRLLALVTEGRAGGKCLDEAGSQHRREIDLSHLGEQSGATDQLPGKSVVRMMWLCLLRATSLRCQMASVVDLAQSSAGSVLPNVIYVYSQKIKNSPKESMPASGLIQIKQSVAPCSSPPSAPSMCDAQGSINATIGECSTGLSRRAGHGPRHEHHCLHRVLRGVDDLLDHRHPNKKGSRPQRHSVRPAGRHPILTAAR